MSENKNTEEVEIYTPTEEELTSQKKILAMIAKAEPDPEVLANLKTLTTEERLARLEMEMEKRVKENAALTLNFAHVINHLAPMVKQIFRHFFEDDNGNNRT